MEVSPALIWLGIGVVLGIIEVLGASGFLLGAAVAAIGMAAVTWLFPSLGIVPQIVVFAIAATVATYVYFRFFRSTDPQSGVDLHDKVGAMVGQQFVLKDPLSANNETKTLIGDTLWTVRSNADVEEGARVRIVGGTVRVIEVEPVA
ncbi:MAG: NfeD family protein [Gammaproteobacteria bacterium]|nr:NfeD family protein [Gammaproteobacteria bacterium]